MKRLLPGLLGIAELASFFAIERALRTDREAATMERGQHDRGSTVAIGATFGFAMLAAPVAALFPRGRLPMTVGWLGNGLMAAGIAIRAWSAATLGENYTRTLRVRSRQGVVHSGPYALVRHPGYAADIVMWAGYGLAWTNFVSLISAALPTTIAYLYRIKVEETMLREELGAEYVQYAARTKRLIPRLF